MVTWFALLVLLATTGCSTYSSQSARVRAHLVDGERQEALEVLAKDGGKEPDVLNQLER